MTSRHIPRPPVTQLGFVKGIIPQEDQERVAGSWSLVARDRDLGAAHGISKNNGCAGQWRREGRYIQHSKLRVVDREVGNGKGSGIKCLKWRKGWA